MDRFHHHCGDLALELLVHIENRLRALPVQLLDRRLVRILDGLAEELLEHAVLLLGGIPGQMQRNDLMGGRRHSCHSCRSQRLCALDSVLLIGKTAMI